MDFSNCFPNLLHSLLTRIGLRVAEIKQLCSCIPDGLTVQHQNSAIVGNKAASVTAVKTKEVLLKEEWGEDLGSRSKMCLWDQRMPLVAQHPPCCHLCGVHSLALSGACRNVSLKLLLCMFTRRAT